jgi:hypothetical protein
MHWQELSGRAEGHREETRNRTTNDDSQPAVDWAEQVVEQVTSGKEQPCNKQAGRAGWVGNCSYDSSKSTIKFIEAVRLTRDNISTIQLGWL